MRDDVAAIERGVSFLDALAEKARSAPGLSPAIPEPQPATGNAPPADSVSREWPEPETVPEDLAQVAEFDYRLLPDRLRPWVADTCELLQCPPDFVAVPAVVALGAVLGRKLAIRPQAKTSWSVIPNVWGCIIGRPGTMKSPAVDEALRPLRRLQSQARELFEAEQSAFEAETAVAKIQQEAAKHKARKAAIEDRAVSASDLHVDLPVAPILRRYTANDSSLEALGELLRQNPNGLLIERDEIASLLAHLSAEGNAGMRGFYLTGADGKAAYTFDRIGRGLDLHVPAVCLSLLGTTQPGRIGAYLRQSLVGGEGDDGLMQRFGLMVWPNHTKDWRNIDRWPDSEARRHAFAVFEALDQLHPDQVRAEAEEGERFLRLAPESMECFVEWRQGLEVQLRSGDLHPALESHFAKYRKTIPALALIFHLADGGNGPVNERSMLRALGWSDYLESHARRCYGAGQASDVSAAKRILERIRKGDLRDGFKARQIKQANWSGLSDAMAVERGLALLIEYGWVVDEKTEAGRLGGRPSAIYRINPRGMNHGMA